MCQIIAMDFTVKSFDLNDGYNRDGVLDSAFSKIEAQIQNILHTKGDPDYTPHAVLVHETGWYKTYTLTKKEGFAKGLGKDITRTVQNALSQRGQHYFRLLIFNRMPPEMESKNTKFSQPYYNQFDNSFYAVHGTIYNDQELAEENNAWVTVDTDIFMFADGKSILEKAKGNYVVCRLPLEKTSAASFEFYSTGGLGVYDVSVRDAFDKYLSGLEKEMLNIHKCFTMSRVTSFDRLLLAEVILADKQSVVVSNKKMKIPSRRTAVALFSGGLDIVSSCVEFKKNNPKVRLIGLYFDWGSVAAECEKAAGNRAREEGLLDDYIIIDVKQPMKHLLTSLGIGDIRLADSNAEGAGHAETEQAISYVPFRNTMFLTWAAAWVEENIDEDHYVDFIIGANLSEAMGGYSDNSNGFIDVIESTLRLGGKNPLKYSVIAPFQYKTKTAMLQYFDKKQRELIDKISFSCYFPDDDCRPCGKCGSCILRAKALRDG